MFADSDNSFNIISLPLILDVDDWSLQTSILSDPEYLSFDCLDFFRESDHAYVANSQYQVDDLDIVFGDNVPVTLFMRPRYEQCYLFVGRYGEIRTVDYANHKRSIKKTAPAAGRRSRSRNSPTNTLPKASALSMKAASAR